MARPGSLPFILWAIVFSFVLSARAADTCYYPDGSTDSGHFACSSGGVSMCCAEGFDCLSNGLCRDTRYDNNQRILRGGCTDKSWGSGCPQRCTSIWKQGDEAVHLCSNGKFCCGRTDSCCDDSSAPSYDFGSPSVIAVAGKTQAEPSNQQSKPSSSQSQPSKPTSKTSEQSKPSSTPKQEDDSKSSNNNNDNNNNNSNNNNNDNNNNNNNNNNDNKDSSSPSSSTDKAKASSSTDSSDKPNSTNTSSANTSSKDNTTDSDSTSNDSTSTNGANGSNGSDGKDGSNGSNGSTNSTGTSQSTTTDPNAPGSTNTINNNYYTDASKPNNTVPIAVGVGVGAGVLLFLCLIAGCWYLRRKKRGPGPRSRNIFEMGEPDAPPVELGDESGVAELDRKTQGFGKGRGTMLFELDGGGGDSKAGPKELPAGVAAREVGSENYGGGGTEKSWGR